MTHVTGVYTPLRSTIHCIVDRRDVTDDWKDVICDASSVTCAHLWHGSLNMYQFYTVIYWRGYFTIDKSYLTIINGSLCISFGDMLIAVCVLCRSILEEEESHSGCIAGAQILQISILAKPRSDTRDKGNFLQQDNKTTAQYLSWALQLQLHLCYIWLWANLRGCYARFSDIGWGVLLELIKLQCTDQPQEWTSCCTLYYYLMYLRILLHF